MGCLPYILACGFGQQRLKNLQQRPTIVTPPSDLGVVKINPVILVGLKISAE